MEYTTDTTEAVDSFLKDQFYQAKHQADNHRIDAASIEFLQGVVVAAGKEIPPELVTAKDAAELGSVTAAGKAVVFLAKLDTAPPEADYTAARVDWLNQYVAGVEREYATHVVIVQISQEVGDTVQVESSTLAMLQCEAAHDSSLKELAVLKGTKGAGTAAVSTRPSSPTD